MADTVGYVMSAYRDREQTAARILIVRNKLEKMRKELDTLERKQRLAGCVTEIYKGIPMMRYPTSSFDRYYCHIRVVGDSTRRSAHPYEDAREPGRFHVRLDDRSEGFAEKMVWNLTSVEEADTVAREWSAFGRVPEGV